jgi:hypothetical protein
MGPLQRRARAMTVMVEPTGRKALLDNGRRDGSKSPESWRIFWLARSDRSIHVTIGLGRPPAVR